MTYEIKDEEERVILVGVQTDDSVDKIEDSLDELEELVETAGGISVCRVTQNRDRIHPGTYIGKGKIEEIKILVDEFSATGIVCDDELSPAQLRNLQLELDIKILDRTQIILDIFAKRASTKEGKIQVELAQLKYRLARLVGLRASLSRLGGGIGTRGPGEKKLEMDRRLINDRISFLKGEIEEVKNHREVTRKKRSESRATVMAIVGYTNAGKSTLLNKLTDAGVLEEDKLFATLDPTTRNLKLPNGMEILLTDTVGFIRKLPHHLIDAFRSTLEEAKYADVIIHVVDSSNPQMDQQMDTVYKTLNDLGATGKTIITLFNKQDKIEESEAVVFKDIKADYTLKTSAKNKQGFDDLEKIFEDVLRKDMLYIEKVYPYSEAGKIQDIRKYGELIKEKYIESGIYVEAYLPESLK